MFALAFRFPAGRYHATPWGRSVNEADIAWPPEPWRLLRALIAVYWRKGGRNRWSDEHLARLVNALSETLPVYRLPEGGIHAHTRHYMPTGKIADGREKTSLVFDAFVRVPKHATVVAAWPNLWLDDELFAFAADLASAVGYLGRAESWATCEALSEWQETANCGPVDDGYSGDLLRLLAPLPPEAYARERERLIEMARGRIRASMASATSASKLEKKVASAFQSKGSKLDTLPERLLEALSLDSADFHDRDWDRPPAAREVVYARGSNASLGVSPRIRVRRKDLSADQKLPKVARFLLAGRPRPPVEDTIRIAELMRLATLSQFGWKESNGRRVPNAPWKISGRDSNGNRLDIPSHEHAFWLPEDADSDGLIDHVSIFIASGIDQSVQKNLDRITRLWIAPKGRTEGTESVNARAMEWRLALEGFGQPVDFSGEVKIFGTSASWLSATPFLASGHLKKAGYAGEVRRLLKRRGIDARYGFSVSEVSVTERAEISVGGVGHRAIQFHRFRAGGGERQPDSAGTMLEIEFPHPIDGPLSLGFGSHFGLGLFVPAD